MCNQQPLEYIKERVNIFLDQNINCKVKIELLKKGYENVLTVYDIEYIGANDNKILKLIKEKKFILVTFDYHFYKMAKKYNKDMVIFMKGIEKSPRTISNIIQCDLINKYKQIKNYYEE